MKADRLLSIPIEKIQPSPYQPRQQFESVQLQELANSLLSTGLIQPIVVRAIADNHYELIAGERRWRAAQLAGFSEMLCLIKDYSDENAMTASLIENIQREELNPIEEAKAYLRLIGECDYSHQKLSDVLGKSRSKISNTLRLLETDELVQSAIIAKQLSEGHGKLLAALAKPAQRSLARDCIEKKWSVRQLEQAIKRQQTNTTVRAITTNADLDVVYLENTLSEQLGSAVQFNTDSTGTGGWLQIRYYDNETLAGILEKLKLEAGDSANT